MTSTVKDGLTFEAAMDRVNEAWDNEVAMAFGRVLRELQLGRLRRDAIKNMAERMDMPDLIEFIHAVVQADEANVSILEVVSAHAQRLRAKYPKQ